MHGQFYSSLNVPAPSLALSLASSSTRSPLASNPPESNSPGLEWLAALSYRSRDLESYLREIALGVSRTIQSDWTIITLCAGEMGKIVASSLDHLLGTGQQETGFSVHGTLIEEVMRSGRSLSIADSRCSDWSDKLASEYRAYLGVPLKTTYGEVIGTICSFLQVPHNFTDSEVRCVELFAERATTAIENHRLYQQQLHFNQRLCQEVAACPTDLAQSRKQLIQREQLAAIGEFTAMIVHEVRNPLTTIEMGLTHAHRVLISDADRQRLDLSLSEIQRLKRLLQEILCYAKPQTLQLARLNITQFLTDFISQVQNFPEAEKRDVCYVQEFPEAEVMADKDKLQQVFFNLFRNAFEAIAPHEVVSCVVGCGHSPSWICVCLHNGGVPIPSELLPQLTTPFCSTKPSGTGLGLAISKQIILAHGGELAIDSSSNGTTVSVHLPIVG